MGSTPFEYLKDSFTRLPVARITELQQFTSAAWAKAHQLEISQAT